MYKIAGSTKRNLVLQWGLPDRIFFACGACQVLAHAFLERYGPSGLKAFWIKPAAGFTGNHIFVAADDGWAFDYHGYSCRQNLLDHAHRKAGRWWPGWTASLTELPPEVLISEAKSRTYEGYGYGSLGSSYMTPGRALMPTSTASHRRPDWD